MSYAPEMRERAILLRKKGYSIKEIATLLDIAKSTSSSWLSSIELNKSALSRLQQQKILGQYKAMQTRKSKKEHLKDQFRKTALKELHGLNYGPTLYKLLCSILFWTEGGKFSDSYVYFMNSDPKLVTLFVKLLRLAYPLDERKFRALVHIHKYHDDNNTKKYWSNLTNIPISQFYRSYNKLSTEKRIRQEYKGCISIRYYDYKIALELRSIYNVLTELIRGVG